MQIGSRELIQAQQRSNRRRRFDICGTKTKRKMTDTIKSGVERDREEH